MANALKTPRIVLTGGPCAGKTTALNYLREKLLDIGFYPIMVPEVPTILITSGITPVQGIFDLTSFERFVIEQTLSFEQTAKRAAHHISHKKPVIIYDRGLMDVRAYTDDTLFESLQEQYELNTVEMRDQRYDAVFHLRTAALGAETFYTKENNSARIETLEEARDADERTLAAWNGHPHLLIIDNSTDFEGKLHRLFKGVCKTLGVPAPLEIERKFLLRDADPAKLIAAGINIAEIEIEQFYLVTPPSENPKVVLRARKRTQYGASIYWKTRKEHVGSGTNVETEEEITADEYEWSKSYRNPSTDVIKKKRYCFVYKDQYFELDIFTEGRNRGLCILEVELTERTEEVTLPPFLSIEREVTDDPDYSNRNLACSV